MYRIEYERKVLNCIPDNKTTKQNKHKPEKTSSKKNLRKDWFYNLLAGLETLTTALPQVSLDPSALSPVGTLSKPLQKERKGSK